MTPPGHTHDAVPLPAVHRLLSRVNRRRLRADLARSACDGAIAASIGLSIAALAGLIEPTGQLRQGLTWCAALVGPALAAGPLFVRWSSARTAAWLDDRLRTHQLFLTAVTVGSSGTTADPIGELVLAGAERRATTELAGGVTRRVVPSAISGARRIAIAGFSLVAALGLTKLTTHRPLDGWANHDGTAVPEVANRAGDAGRPDEAILGADLRSDRGSGRRADPGDTVEAFAGGLSTPSEQRDATSASRSDGVGPGAATTPDHATEQQSVAADPHFSASEPAEGPAALSSADPAFGPPITGSEQGPVAATGAVASGVMPPATGDDRIAMEIARNELASGRVPDFARGVARAYFGLKTR